MRIDDETKRICFDDEDREFFNNFGLKESEVNAEAWHRALAQAYYLGWNAKTSGNPISDERLTFEFIGEYHCQKAKLEGYLQLVPREPCV